MVWELGVEKLDEAVAFVGTGDDGQFVAENLNAIVPLLADEAAFTGRRRDETEDGGSVGSGTSSDGKGRAIGEGNTGEADDGRIERGEVATEPCSDAAGMVGAKGGYGASDDGLGGEDEGVVCVDG